MALDVLAELREARKLAQAGSTRLALSSLRKALREFDGRIRPKPSPINESETNSPEDPEWERTSATFMLCKLAALELGSSRPDVTRATQSLDKAILAFQKAADQPA